jgi:HlyD family secretion protein
MEPDRTYSDYDYEQIQPGMSALIIPNTGDRMGGIMGHVIEISEPPVTTLDAARRIDLTDALRSSQVEVIVDLNTMTMPDGGDRPMSTRGQLMALTPGTTTKIQITLEEKAPIAFIFPFLDLRTIN